MQYSAVIESPIAGVRLGVVSDADFVYAIVFLDEETTLRAAEDPLASRVAEQLDRYFHTADFYFDLPLKAEGTEFQQRVWRAIKKIKPGTAIYYGEIAKQLNSSAQAVGNACGANPLPIVVPCHRVVAKSGLGGFMGQAQGDSLNIKRWLLEHERSFG